MTMVVVGEEEGKVEADEQEDLPSRYLLCMSTLSRSCKQRVWSDVFVEGVRKT